MTAPGATGFGFMGLAREATKGTAVDPEDSIVYVPVTRADGEDTVDVLRDEGMRGSMTTFYGAVPGVKSASFDVEGDVHLDTIGHFAAAILGEIKTTGSDAPYTHVFTLNNDRETTRGQCPSYTFTDFQGLTARQYAAATCSSLSFRLSAQELLTYSASFTTKASILLDSIPSPNFSDSQPTAGWTGTVTVGSSGSALVEEAEINFSRNVSLVHTVDGAADPFQIWQGPISVSGRLMLVAPNEDEWDRYMAVETPALQFKFEKLVGGVTHSLQIDLSKVAYTSAKLERGDDFTQVSVQFDAIATASDAGTTGGLAPAKVTLINDVEDYDAASGS